MIRAINDDRAPRKIHGIHAWFMWRLVHGLQLWSKEPRGSCQNPSRLAASCSTWSMCVSTGAGVVAFSVKSINTKAYVHGLRAGRRQLRWPWTHLGVRSGRRRLLHLRWAGGMIIPEKSWCRQTNRGATCSAQPSPSSSLDALISELLNSLRWVNLS
jgi:hypothetical protein